MRCLQSVVALNLEPHTSLWYMYGVALTLNPFPLLWNCKGVESHATNAPSGSLQPFTCRKALATVHLPVIAQWTFNGSPLRPFWGSGSTIIYIHIYICIYTRLNNYVRTKMGFERGSNHTLAPFQRAPHTLLPLTKEPSESNAPAVIGRLGSAPLLVRMVLGYGFPLLLWIHGTQTAHLGETPWTAFLGFPP